MLKLAHVAVSVLFLALPTIAYADLVDVANEVRSRGCGNRSLAGHPLRQDARLDEAARRLAAGHKLKTVTLSSGYRAGTSASIRLRTSDGDGAVARMLAKRFCDIVADPTLAEIGVHRHSDEIWMVLATPSVPPNPADVRVIGKRIVELINAARSAGRKCGRRKFPAAPPMQQNTALEQAALAHARDMADKGFLDHAGSDGSLPADRLSRAGYAWANVAENVAAGQTTASEVVDTWLESPGHCANLMDARYTDTGVAFAVNARDDRGTYWVQLYARGETR